MKNQNTIIRKINQYFDSLKGGVITDESGNQLFDKKGVPLTLPDKPPTVAGLCRSLGLGSRDELAEYANSELVGKTVRAALMRIEEYTESRLFDHDASKGAEIILKNEFAWQDRSNTADMAQGLGVVILSDIPDE